MSQRSAAWLAAAVLEATLCGCAHWQVGSDGLGFAERRAKLETVAAWAVRGRLAIDNGERAFLGSFDWRQDEETSTLEVRGPLGAGVLRVSGTP